MSIKGSNEKDVFAYDKRSSLGDLESIFSSTRGEKTRIRVDSTPVISGFFKNTPISGLSNK